MTRLCVCLVLAVALVQCHFTFKRSQFAEVDSRSTSFPEAKVTSVEALAKGLCDEHTEDLLKYRAVFKWVVTHIKYDYDLLSKIEDGEGKNRSPEEVLKDRIAVCGGISNLVVALAGHCGLSAFQISGISKSGLVASENTAGRKDIVGHAWVAVTIDGKIRLSDPTWALSTLADVDDTFRDQQATDSEGGAGAAEDVELSADAPVSDEDPHYYFLINPRELMYTHFPSNSSHQLITPPLDQNGWDLLSKTRAPYFKYQISMKERSNVLPNMCIEGEEDSSSACDLSHTADIARVGSRASIVLLTPDDDVVTSGEVHRVVPPKEGSNKSTLEKVSPKSILTFTDKQDDSDSRLISAVFPSPGDYVVRVFARRLGEVQWQHAVDYRFEASEGEGEFCGFPKALFLYKEMGCNLIEPRRWYQKSWSPFNVRLTLKKPAKDVMVKGCHAEGDRVFLHVNDAGEWAGSCVAVKGDITVFADFGEGFQGLVLMEGVDSDKVTASEGPIIANRAWFGSPVAKQIGLKPESHKELNIEASREIALTFTSEKSCQLMGKLSSFEERAVALWTSSEAGTQHTVTVRFPATGSFTLTIFANNNGPNYSLGTQYLVSVAEAFQDGALDFLRVSPQFGSYGVQPKRPLSLNLLIGSPYNVELTVPTALSVSVVFAAGGTSVTLKKQARDSFVGSIVAEAGDMHLFAKMGADTQAEYLASFVGVDDKAIALKGDTSVVKNDVSLTAYAHQLGVLALSHTEEAMEVQESVTVELSSAVGIALMGQVISKLTAAPINGHLVHATSSPDGKKHSVLALFPVAGEHIFRVLAKKATDTANSYSHLMDYNVNVLKGAGEGRSLVGVTSVCSDKNCRLSPMMGTLAVGEPHEFSFSGTDAEAVMMQIHGETIQFDLEKGVFSATVVAEAATQGWLFVKFLDHSQFQGVAQYSFVGDPKPIAAAGVKDEL